MSAATGKTKRHSKKSKKRPSETKRESGVAFATTNLPLTDLSNDKAWEKLGGGALGSYDASTRIIALLIELCKKQLTDSWVDSLEDDTQLMGLDLLMTPARSWCRVCCKTDHTSGSHVIKWCSGCYAVRYCSKKCQKEDRKEHEKECGPDMRLSSMDEYQYATVRMFNDTFRLLLANISPKRYPLTVSHPERMAYRGWMCRVVCEKVGAICAREAVEILIKKCGADKLMKFCVDPKCKSQECLKNRKLFEDKGFSVQLGRSAIEELKRKRGL